MKIFDNYNEDTKCHICGTNKPGKAVLIPLDSTDEDGLEVAIQVHLDCIKIRCKYMNDGKVFIYQIDEDKADVGKILEEE